MAGFLPPEFRLTEEGWRHRAAAYAVQPGLGRGWFQDGRHLHQKKATKAFIWPKDGKNGSVWGRLKDVLRNDGPDMYVAFGANEKDCVSNRPTRSQWSRHDYLDDRGMCFRFDSRKHSPWTRDSGLGGRSSKKIYDFRTRKYITPERGMWSDAIWQPEPYKNRKQNRYPEAVRDMDGRWWQDDQYLPQFLGGPVDNEFGEGAHGWHLPSKYPLF
ncbi:hypothetical protein NX059_006102 [Plenodomus lindquistii]|nr:hypothetical protein NX059_006102 [Plenodomus lindquistii]